MEQHIEVTIRRGCSMSIEDKIDMINFRLEMHRINLAEHHRILIEDLPLSLDTDNLVVRSMIPEIEAKISALEELKISIEEIQQMASLQ